MKDKLANRVRRIEVTDPIALDRPHDYADSFELRLEDAGDSPPESWLRDGIDDVPRWIKIVAGAPDGVAGVGAVTSDPEVAVLEDSDPLMQTVLIARNVAPGHRVFTTVLTFRRRRLARAVWSLVGILHRHQARRVVAGGLVRA